MRALGLSAAAMCWSVALLPSQDAPTSLLQSFASKMAGAGTKPAGQASIERVSHRGVLLAAIRSHHAVQSAAGQLLDKAESRIGGGGGITIRIGCLQSTGGPSVSAASGWTPLKALASLPFAMAKDSARSGIVVGEGAPTSGGAGADAAASS